MYTYHKIISHIHILIFFYPRKGRTANKKNINKLIFPALSIQGHLLRFCMTGPPKNIPGVLPHLRIWPNYLVGGFNPFEKYSSKWIISPSKGEHKKYLSCHNPVIIFHPPRFFWNFRGPIVLPKSYLFWGEGGGLRSRTNLTSFPSIHACIPLPIPSMYGINLPTCKPHFTFKQTTKSRYIYQSHTWMVWGYVVFFFLFSASKGHFFASASRTWFGPRRGGGHGMVTVF